MFQVAATVRELVITSKRAVGSYQAQLAIRFTWLRVIELHNHRQDVGMF